MADVLKRVPVREQDAKVRATNFEEVCYGYNMEEAMGRGNPLPELQEREMHSGMSCGDQHPRIYFQGKRRGH